VKQKAELFPRYQISWVGCLTAFVRCSSQGVSFTKEASRENQMQMQTAGSDGRGVLSGFSEIRHELDKRGRRDAGHRLVEIGTIGSFSI
jgi:hypothetical protein